jgi:hypothetical protein
MFDDIAGYVERARRASRIALPCRAMADPRRASVQTLIDSLKDVKTKWPMRGWSFDNRFICVASTFGIEMAEKARAAIALALPRDWTERTLPNAPSVLRELASRTGGVRANQYLFSSDLVAGATAYGLWWPWEEGRTISLRIGIEGAGDVTVPLCEVFGVEP